MATAEHEVITEAGGIAVYNQFRAQLAELRANNAAVVFDYASEKGAKEARSHIYKLKKTKGAVEACRKEEKAASLEYGRRVDAEAKEIASQIDEMIEVHERPLREIEQREAERKQEILNKLGRLSGYLALSGLSSEQGSAKRAELDAIEIDESYAESMAPATKLKKDALAHLDALIAAAKQQEAEAAELERLRKETAAREQAERDARIAAEATARAEAKAAARAEQERKASEARELAERQKAERAEREAQEAIAKAERAAKEAEDRVRREAEAKAKAEAEAAAKREANKAHRARINNAAVEALMALAISRELGEAIVTAIAKGEIPAVSIAY